MKTIDTGKQLWAVLLIAVVSTSGIAGTTILRFSEVFTNGIDGIDGLDGLRYAVLSPDDRHVYAAGTHQNSLVVFERDVMTGRLNFVEVFFDDQDGVDGLGLSFAVGVSPDGAFVYVSAAGDNAIAIFERNPANGTLTYVGQEQNLGMGVTGLTGASGLDISLDGQYLYATGDFDHALSTYQRNLLTGELEFQEIHVNGVGNVSGLMNVMGVTISPDGQNVYCAALWGRALTVFNRDAMGGNLSFANLFRDGVAGVDGLYGALAVWVTHDGRFAYVTGLYDHAVAVFSRNTVTGDLTYVTNYKDGVNGIETLLGSSRANQNMDGKNLFVAAFWDNTLNEFLIDPMTGELEHLVAHTNGVGGIQGLEGPAGIAVSGDGLHVYVACTASGSIALFETFQSVAAGWPLDTDVLELMTLIR